MTVPRTKAEDYSSHWVNLASAKLGACARICSDDFFASMHRMLNDEPPVWQEGVFDDHGKWMDGWESRRRRTPGHDWCVVQLARPGAIHGVEIDTRFFTGNYPPEISVEACISEHEIPDEKVNWHEIVRRSPVQGDSFHQYPLDGEGPFSHVRLNMFPDGGLARFRVYGEPRVDWEAVQNDAVDLASALNGAIALSCNDQHYGDIRYLLTPGRGVNMGDGWETRRRREPGNDWVIIALAHAGTIESIDIDTAHFKGNYPESVDIRGARLRAISLESLESQSESWETLLEKSPLSADAEHHFSKVNPIGPITHVRVNIHPDGGLSRVRLFGKIALPA
ncbi:MAG: allantoicase [Pseudomonadota bacterium]